MIVVCYHLSPYQISELEEELEHQKTKALEDKEQIVSEKKWPLGLFFQNVKEMYPDIRGERD